MPDDDAARPAKSKPASRRRRSTDAEAAEGWAEFWAAYPRKVNRPAALRAWNKLAPGEALREQISRSLAAQLPAFAERESRFIPHAATWINGERWTDEPERPAQSPGTPAHGNESLAQRAERKAREGDERERRANTIRPSVADSFQHKTYTGTPDEELPDFLRPGRATIEHDASDEAPDA